MLMKKILTITILILSIFTYNADMIKAKREAPVDVEPVIYEGIKYTAPHNKMGYIEALDAETDEIIQEIKVYEINYIPVLEKDVQDIFINKLAIENGKLIAYREGGKKYTLELSESGELKQKQTMLYLFLASGLVIIIIIAVIIFLVKNKS
jgi:hypothetical protein